MDSYEEGKVSCSKKIQIATKKGWAFLSYRKDK